MLIREYHFSDRASILELFRLNTPAAFAESEEEDLVVYLDEHLERYFVIESEKQILACGGINRSDEAASVKISWDMVHPEYQGSGLGKQLLEHRLAEIRKNPAVTKVIVRTSQLANLFSEKAGFTPVEIIPDYWAKGFDLYRMELFL